MPYTLKQASAATGRERTTLLRAIQSGKLSAMRDEATGSWIIEPSELHRVYPPAESTGADDGDAEARTPDALTEALAEIRELRARLEAAEDGIRLREDVIADLRQQRDQEATERRQAQTQLTALLTDQRNAQQESQRRIWRLWRRGGRAPNVLSENSDPRQFGEAAYATSKSAGFHVRKIM